MGMIYTRRLSLPVNLYFDVEFREEEPSEAECKRVSEDYLKSLLEFSDEDELAAGVEGMPDGTRIYIDLTEIRGSGLEDWGNVEESDCDDATLSTENLVLSISSTPTGPTENPEIAGGA